MFSIRLFVDQQCWLYFLLEKLDDDIFPAFKDENSLRVIVEMPVVFSFDKGKVMSAYEANHALERVSVVGNWLPSHLVQVL